MKKNIKKIFTITGVALALGSASTAYAANTFTFSFVTNVIGTTEFELRKGNTTCDSKAYTYKYDTNSYASFIGNYRIDLDGNGVLNQIILEHTIKLMDICTQQIMRT